MAKVLGKVTKIMDSINTIVNLAKSCSKDEGLILLVEYLALGAVWGIVAAGFYGFLAIPILMPLIIAFIGFFITGIMFELDLKTCKKMSRGAYGS